ncbi:ferredoxin-NADP reductase [Bradyrhizobium sp. GM22.5]
MNDLKAGLTTLGVAPDRIHTELFGAGPSLTPGIASSPQKRAHPPIGAPGPGPMVSFARSGLNVRWGPSYASLLELAEARRATSPCAGRAGPASATIARAG